jgi:hypothetical protein
VRRSPLTKDVFADARVVAAFEAGRVLAAERGGSEPHTLLDELVPAYDVASRHTIWVAADPPRVYQAARHADLSRPWLVRFLMRLRTGPAWLATRFRGHRGPAHSAHHRPSVGPVAFTVLAEAPDQELVLGIMGRFWTVTGGLVTASAAQLREPPPAGLAQGFWNFHVEPCGNGTALSTETRVRCGDPATRRRFKRYWRLIRLGSGLIRGSLLRHIRRRAERRAA